MRKTTLIILTLALSVFNSGCDSESRTTEVNDPVASSEDWTADSIADFTKKAIELVPQLAEAYNKRAHAYYKQGELDKAIADFTKAIELDPQLAIAYNNRGKAYYKQGEFDKAITDLTKAIELDPAYARAYNNRGFIFEKLGNEEKAEADFTKAKELGYEPE